MATSSYRNTKKPFTMRRFIKQAKRFLIRLARTVARGLYYGIKAAYTFLMALPPKLLLVASSAFGFLVIAVIIIAVASPGSRTSANAANTIANFQSDWDAVDSSLIDSGNIDPYASYDPNANVPPDQPAALDDDATQAGDSEPDPDPQTPAFTELKRGDDHPAVAKIQVRLMELGYMDPDEPTEHFGSLTASSLTTFQKHNGLAGDGVCGQSSYELLMSDSAKPYVMQRGDAGDDVEGVQQRLYELAYLDNKANITGTFGEKTEEAAKAFQAKNKLTADGKVGEKTISLLYGEDVVSNSYKLGDENPVIRSCQEALKKAGYITFAPDGVMGRATVSAIKSFQEINGLTKDGSLGPETRDLLLSGEAQSKVIQLGHYGTDVKNIQERLIKLNYLTSGSATAYFGEVTQDAIKAFQKRNGLGADGKVGAVTLTLLNSSSAKKGSAPVNEKKASSSSGSSASSGSSGSGSSSGSSGSSSGSSSVGNKTGVEKFIALAESKKGCNYVRGAKGPNSFDCSGFVYWCMKNAGISCSYQTSLMWRTCSKYQRITSMSKLQRGDVLVFYGHVGIYIGNGNMIDASSSAGEVRQSSTVLKSGGYWEKNFICAYRIF